MMNTFLKSVFLGAIFISSPAFSQQAKDVETAIAYYAFQQLKAMPIISNRTVRVGDLLIVNRQEDVLAAASRCYPTLRTKSEEENGAASGRTHHISMSIETVASIAAEANVRRLITAEATLEALFKDSSAVVFSGVTGTVPDPDIQELFSDKVETTQECRPTTETLAQHRYDRVLVTRTYSGSIDVGFAFERGTSAEIAAATDVIGQYISDASVTAEAARNSKRAILGNWDRGVIAVQSSRLNPNRLAEAWLVMNQDIDTVIELEELVQEYLQSDDFEIREGIAGAIRNLFEEWGYFQQDFIEYRRSIFAGEEGQEYSPQDIPDEHWRAAAAFAAAILIAFESA